MPPPDIVGAINSLKTELVSIMRGVVLGANNIGTPPSASGKNINDLMIENNKYLDEVNKSLNKSRDSIEKQTKDLQLVGTGLAILGPALHMFSQYTVSLPMRMLSGAAGTAAGIAADREKDFGATLTRTIGGLMMLSPASKTLGMGIIAAGEVGGNAIIGKKFREEMMPAAIRQMALQYVAGGRLGIDESYMYRYNIERGDSAARNMRAGQGGSSSEISAVLSKMGIGSQESAAGAMTIMSQGARGYSKFDMNKIFEMTEKGGGAYGFDPIQNAIAVRQAQRLGFSTEEMQRASKLTGFQFTQQAAAMQQVRGQTFMLGMGAGNQIYNAAAGTTLGQVLGPQAAVQTSMQMGQATAGAAAGSDAAEMLLFQQFQDANPGATYPDFLEAKSMGSASDKWVTMMAKAAKNFSAMGQWGGLLGVGLGVFKGASSGAMSEATKFARQQAREIGVEPLTAEEQEMRRARLGQAAIERQEGIKAEAFKLPDLLRRETGGAMELAHIDFMKNIEASGNLSEMVKRAADIQELYLIPALKGVADSIDTKVPGYLKDFSDSLHKYTEEHRKGSTAQKKR